MQFLKIILFYFRYVFLNKEETREAGLRGTVWISAILSLLLSLGWKRIFEAASGTMISIKKEANYTAEI